MDQIKRLSTGEQREWEEVTTVPHCQDAPSFSRVCSICHFLTNFFSFTQSKTKSCDTNGLQPSRLPHLRSHHPFISLSSLHTHHCLSHPMSVCLAGWFPRVFANFDS